jgi:5'-3' exonuclease
MKYLLVDTANMFFRARHVAARGSDSWSKVGMSLHITFNALLKSWRLHKPDHVIFCLEGRSWRKDFASSYKRNRQQARDAMSSIQAEEDKMFWETYDELVTWLQSSTNSSVVRCNAAEADDLIARWIALHPQDQHIICSTDSDFYQLLAPNVTIENGVTNQVITLDGVFDEKGKPVIDKKTKEHKKIGDPKWVLFEKIMRGDTSDNVFSAYPGVRTKGSAKKVGLLEAFEDRDKKGYAWNNMMLQRWTDHEGVEHRVLDCYERNRVLIDLTAQPDDIKAYIDDYLLTLTSKQVGMVGAKFLKFCGKYELDRMSQNAQGVAEILSQRLPQESIDQKVTV